MTNNRLSIPSREEFHKYASNLLSISDFDTEHHAYDGYQINRVVSALNWSRDNHNARNYHFQPKGGAQNAR